MKKFYTQIGIYILLSIITLGTLLTPHNIIEHVKIYSDVKRIFINGQNNYTFLYNENGEIKQSQTDHTTLENHVTIIQNDTVQPYIISRLITTENIFNLIIKKKITYTIYIPSFQIIEAGSFTVPITKGQYEVINIRPLF